MAYPVHLVLPGGLNPPDKPNPPDKREAAVRPEVLPGTVRPRSAGVTGGARPRTRSETTTRHRYAIRGYISTAAKHGISVFTALRDAIAGNPWIPPIPASA
jgi:hypothetical protein